MCILFSETDAVCGLWGIEVNSMKYTDKKRPSCHLIPLISSVPVKIPELYIFCQFCTFLSSVDSYFSCRKSNGVTFVIKGNIYWNLKFEPIS